MAVRSDHSIDNDDKDGNGSGPAGQDKYQMNLVLAISPGNGKGPFEIDFELGGKGPDGGVLMLKSLKMIPCHLLFENDTITSTFQAKGEFNFLRTLRLSC